MTRSENFEYVGAGLDAGECGIRFKSLSTREGGPWSCHVGLTSGVPELRENILATIRGMANLISSILNKYIRNGLYGQLGFHLAIERYILVSSRCTKSLF